MAIAHGDKDTKNIGSWQELFVPSTSDHVKKLRNDAIRTPEVCLERVRTEMKLFDAYKDEPRIVQRARFLETYLKDKTVFIGDDELIVGNMNSPRFHHRQRSDALAGAGTGRPGKRSADPSLRPPYYFPRRTQRTAGVDYSIFQR